MPSERVIEKGMIVEITHDYDVFHNNAKGMRAVVIRPYSVDKEEGSYNSRTRVVKHLVFIEEIDYYAEPRDEWLIIINKKREST